MPEVRQRWPRLIEGDCLTEMDSDSSIEPCSVDMVLCDLPYGITQNKWDSVIPLRELWGRYFRVCTGPAAIVLTASQPFASALVMSCVDSFKYEWIWVKTRITGVLNAKRMPVRKHEQVLVFCRGLHLYNAQGLVRKGTITKQGGNSDNYGDRSSTDYIQEFTNWPRDVLEIPSEGRLHPTQKPVALMEYMIKTYTHEGMTVLDNCMGSGTTGVACANLNRKFIGIEKDPEMFQIAKKRIMEAIERNK